MSGAFRFRLEKVLSLRETEEKECARRLAAARLEEGRKRTRLASLEAALEQMYDHVQRRNAEVKPAGVMVRDQNALESLSRDIDSARTELVEAMGRSKGIMAELEEAMGARKALENLRERQREEWITAESRMEQGMLDETASRRSAHARRAR